MVYDVVKPNISTENAKRINKEKKKWSIYRDGKSSPHFTVNGIGRVGKLIKENI